MLVFEMIMKKWGIKESSGRLSPKVEE